MRRISTATKVTDKFGPGKHGFTNGNAVSGVPATDMEDVWFDHVQEEISGVVEGTGGTLDPNNRGQLLAAIQKLLLTAGHGQCRLSVVSGTQIKLAPYNGNNLIINGVLQQIPSAGVTLANTGLAASTLYYVYAYMNAATMTLEAVTTTHATGTNGVEQKSGDATRTLVGMIYTNSSTPGQFVDSPTQRFCLNWFNRRALSLYFSTTAPVNFTNSSSAEITSTLRVNMLSWADEAISASGSGTAGNNTAGATIQLGLVADGVTFGNYVNMTLSGTISQLPYAIIGSSPLSEGVHVLQTYGSTTSGTATLGASQGFAALAATVRG